MAKCQAGRKSSQAPFNHSRRLNCGRVTIKWIRRPKQPSMRLYCNLHPTGCQNTNLGIEVLSYKCLPTYPTRTRFLMLRVVEFDIPKINIDHLRVPLSSRKIKRERNVCWLILRAFRQDMRLASQARPLSLGLLLKPHLMIIALEMSGRIPYLSH